MDTLASIDLSSVVTTPPKTIEGLQEWLLNFSRFLNSSYSQLRNDVAAHTDSTVAHVLTGASHTVSGLTTGHFLRSLSATTFGFAALIAGDLPSAIDVVKIGAGAVDNTEFSYLDGVTSAIQTQLNAKQPLDADLTVIAALANTDSNIIVGNGAAWVAESGTTARTSLGVGTTDTVTLAGIILNGDAVFSAEVDNGDSGAADTVDWTLGNKQKSTLTGNCTFTFTAPAGPCNLILKLIQGGAGSFIPVWPATVKWSGGAVPTWSTAISAVDIVSFYYDSTNYYGVGSKGFA